jgi:hypothetical protein
MVFVVYVRGVVSGEMSFLLCVVVVCGLFFNIDLAVIMTNVGVTN